MQLLWGDESSSRISYQRWLSEVKPPKEVEDAGAGWFYELIESFENSPAGATVPVQANRAQPPIAWCSDSGFHWHPTPTPELGSSVGPASPEAPVKDRAPVAPSETAPPNPVMLGALNLALLPYQEELLRDLEQKLARHKMALSSPNEQPLPVPPEPKTE